MSFKIRTVVVAAILGLAACEGGGDLLHQDRPGGSDYSPTRSSGRGGDRNREMQPQEQAARQACYRDNDQDACAWLNQRGRR